ncbi:MAG TPA: hypothetical protein VEJ63_10430, partial [Planctomycetota bacterium]|nr:hypothetical protein [Planctomycetota bacterium]
MPMLRPTLASILAAAIICMSGVRAADEQPAEPAKDKPKRVWQQLRPERLVSEDTFLFVGTPDMTRLKAAFERTALNGLLNEEEIRNPVIATFAKLRDAYIKGDNLRNDSETRRRTDEINLLQRMLPLLDGQVAIAIDAQSQQGNRLPKFLFIASMPNEDRQRELETMFDKYRFSQTTDPRYRDINDRVGQYDVYKMENSEIGLHEAWGFVENLFVYGQGEKIVEEAIERYTIKNGAGTLSLNQGYQGAFKEVGRDEKGESLVYLQADVRALLKSAPMFAPMMKVLNDANAAAALDAARPHIAVGLQIGDGANAPIRERILFRLPKEVLPGRPPESFRSAAAKFAQNDTLYFTSFQLNVGEMYKSAGFKGFAKGSRLMDWAKDLTGAANEAEIVSKLEMFKGECAYFMNYVPQATPRFESVQDVFETFQLVIAVELDRDLNEVAFKNLMNNIEKGTKQA